MKSPANALAERRVGAADFDASDLLPQDEEEQYARPANKASASPQPTRPLAEMTGKFVAVVGDKPASSEASLPVIDDTMAEYYKLRNISPADTSPLSSQAFHEARPQKIVRHPPSCSGSPQASSSASERNAGARSPLQSTNPPTQSSLAVPVKATPVHGRWSWPSWALDNKQPCIEVYVEDEEAHEGRWISECTPLHRVVHPDGYDQFLACEYIWDGEPYEQDF